MTNYTRQPDVLPAPPETEAPKLHSKSHPYECPATPGPHSLSFRIGKPCKHCGAIPQLTATPDRPIQAGDWVECVNAYSDGGLGLLFGHRYEVRSVAGDKSGYLELDGVRHPLIGWASERFKLVDGPHSEASPVFRREFAAVFVQPTCSECKAPAALDPDCGMCAYCVTSTGHGDETQAAQDRIMRWSTDTHHGAEARQRLAAIERKERPRVTRDSIELAKPHPWECDE